MSINKHQAMLAAVIVIILMSMACLQDANKEAPAAVLQELAASQESEDTLRSSSGHSSTSMSVRELASPSPTTDEVCVSVCLCIYTAQHI